MHTHWAPIKLNDGRAIPSIAFGSHPHPEAETPSIIATAIRVGFRHIDTAQNYKIQTGVGKGIKQSGTPRASLYITTKWSGLAPIAQSMNDSLEQLAVDYVDLYLIHSPVFPGGADIEANWLEMEKLVEEGKTGSIGVSNYTLDHLKRTLAVCSIKPAVNQIFIHPANYASTKPLLAYMSEHGILAEAYSPLKAPADRQRYPELVKVVEDIAEKAKLQPEQVLLAWSKAKKLLPITTSAKEERMARFISAGDVGLSEADIYRIEQAGGAGC